MPVDLPELLRSQAKRYRCDACGENMGGCGISVLAQHGNRALVRVTCSSCKDENLLQIIFQTEGAMTEAPEKPRPTIDEGRPASTDPIAPDEVLDLHNALAHHEGSLTELLAKR